MGEFWRCPSPLQETCDRSYWVTWYLLVQNAKANILILETFFRVWLDHFLEKRDRSKFAWLALLYKHFFKLKFNPIWVSKKRNDKESMICLTPTPRQVFLFFFCLPYTEQKGFIYFFFFFTEKELFKEKRCGGLNKKTKRRLFNCSPSVN